MKSPKLFIGIVGPLLIVVAAGTSPSTQVRPLDGAVTWLGRPAAAAVVELIPIGGVAEPVPDDTVLIDQRHLRFAPNVVGISAGTVIEFQNSDPIMHNVFSPERQGANFDLGTYPQEESRTHMFDEPGTYVILCHVHPEMAAWVVVSASPYIGVTDEEGSFSMESVPPGQYDVTVWYRRRSASGGTVTVSGDGAAALQIDIGRQ